MNLFTKMIGVIALSAGLSFTAKAELVSIDLYVEGDSLAVLDTTSGLEWAQFSLTLHKSLNEVASMLETTYVGWRLPSASEVKTLVHNVFGEQYYNSYGYNSQGSYNEGAPAWREHFGTTSNQSWGLYKEDDGQIWLSGADQTYLYNGYNYYSHTLDQNHVNAGVFLVNDGGVSLSSLSDPTLNINNPNAPINTATSVDVPPSMALFLVALLLLGNRNPIRNSARMK